jgi:hypothetical protein
MTRRLVPVACGLLLLAGCALSRHPRIAELKYDPGRYQNHTVTLDGVVTSSWGVPLVPFRLYRIDDGTGEVTVVSSSGRVPNRGSRVSVTGRVEEFATLGGQSIGLHIQQRDIHFRRY